MKKKFPSTNWQQWKKFSWYRPNIKTTMMQSTIRSTTIKQIFNPYWLQSTYNNSWKMSTGSTMMEFSLTIIFFIQVSLTLTQKNKSTKWHSCKNHWNLRIQKWSFGFWRIQRTGSQLEFATGKLSKAGTSSFATTQSAMEYMESAQMGEVGLIIVLISTTGSVESDLRKTKRWRCCMILRQTGWSSWWMGSNTTWT